jgi:hypothetical protein
VACFAAKRVGLAVFVSFVTAKRACTNKHERCYQKHKESTTRARFIEVQLRISGDFRGRRFVPAPALDKSAQDYNQQAKDQNRWKDYVSKDSEIRVFLFRRDLNQEQALRWRWLPLRN